MTRSGIRILFQIVLLAGICFNPALSQNYLVHHYTVNDGLASSLVYDITQDTRGRIWFACRNGVSRYDGFDWMSFNLAVGLPSNTSYRIESDQRGGVWATDKQLMFGLSHYSEGRWKYIGRPDAGDIRQIYVNTLNTATKNDTSVTVLIGTIKSGLYLFSDNNWYHFDASNSIVGDKIYSVVSAKDQFLILSNHGLARLRNKQPEPWIPAGRGSLPKNLISMAAEYEHDSLRSARIWFVTRTGLGYFEAGSTVNVASLRDISLNIEPLSIRIQPDYQGGLFLGDQFVIYHYNAQTGRLEILNRANGLLTEGVINFLTDREYNLWIAQMRGVSKIPNLRFRNYTVDHGLYAGEVTALIEDARGAIVLGHEGGLSFLDNGQINTVKLEGFTQFEYEKRVLDLARDTKGNIWGAVRGYGLIKINPRRQVERVENVPAREVTSVVCDADDQLFLATLTGILKYDGSVFSKVDLRLGRDLFVRKLFLQDDGSFFAATKDAGVLHIRGKEVRQYHMDHDKKANNIFAVLKDFKGRTLVGTIAGLYYLDGDSLSKFDMGFSINRPVYLLLRDKQRRLWIGTNNGVYMYTDSKLRHFSPLNGFAGMDINRSAGLEDSEGRLWIGSDRGVSLYQDRYDIPVRPDALLFLEKFQADALRLAPDQDHSIAYSYDNFVFKFSCSSFVDEKNIAYRYKLDGVDRNWIYEGKLYKPEVRYSNLHSGVYRFHVQIKNIEGQWSPEVVSGQIKIRPAFWHTWYFLALCVIASLGLAYFLFAFISRKKNLHRLEQIIERRTLQLRESEKKYRRLFEESQDPVFISSPKGRFIDINPAGVLFFGYESKQEMLDLEDVRKLYENPDERKRFVAQINRDGYVHDYEMHLKKKDGRHVIAIMSATAEYDDQGNIISYRGFLKDVTERWHLREQLAQAQKMESVGMLAGGVAHDFNNILGGILGYASLLKMKISPDDLNFKMIDTIEKSALRGAELTNQLLAFARRGEPKKQSRNLNSIVEETIKIIRSTFPKMIEISTSLEDRLPNVFADKTQLQQIAMNLCVNSRDAIQKSGHITLTTKQVQIDEVNQRMYMDARPGSYVVLEVSDDGSGMDEETLSHIFEPFYSTKDQGKGTGLGLSMVYGFVKNHSGFLDVESAPGRGTTFRVFLPAYDAPVEAHKSDVKRNTSGKEKILVVDDEEVLREFCKQALEAQGYSILLAGSGRQAIEIFQKEKAQIDLVLLDMIMAQMDGLETFQELRAINPQARIVISSGYSDRERIQTLKREKVNGFIHKPYRAEDLLRQVREILDG